MSTQSSPRRATSPESSPEYGYANAPGPQQEENDDVVFLLSVPRGAADNPIVVEDHEDAPSTGEARADDNVVVISDEEEEEERPNALLPPLPTMAMPQCELDQPPVLAILSRPVSSSKTPTTRPLPPAFLEVTANGRDPHAQSTLQRPVPDINKR
ncbi:hypothetical protein CDV36_009801 [Fusarium kuroshium]|uniref:Uncharacterized protein n=1 Tax=Fusarium kuroshium TaxID=2010991 RepID=A0A3M2RZ78_9HYPO|nr:hypothetical protein CDV36_009801 [Fusarium kuroshium]